MKIERTLQTCLNENRKKKFPQSLQRCAERKADFQYSACFPRFWFTFDCIKIALDSLRRKVNVEKTRHAIEILFRLKGSNDQENHFWSEKCVNLKRRDIKFLVRAKKNHCLWFLSPRLTLSKKFFERLRLRKNQTCLKKTSQDLLSKNNFSGIKIERSRSECSTSANWWVIKA